MTSIKAPTSLRKHTYMFSGEVIFLYEEDGKISKRREQVNAIECTDEQKILPGNLGRAQVAMQQQVFNAMGDAYKNVKGVVDVFLYGFSYMGHLTNKERSYGEPPAAANQEESETVQ